MADAFAELMQAESEVRGEMRRRVQTGSVTAIKPLMADKPAQRAAKPAAVDVAARLRALGLGDAYVEPGTKAAPRPSAPVVRPASEASNPAPRAPRAAVPAPALVSAPAAAAAPAAPPGDGGLQTVLSLRKAQLSKARQTQQLGLPQGDGDSDDDDDSDDEAPISASAGGTATNGGGGGGGGGTFAREVNRLGDESAKVRAAALGYLSSATLSSDERRETLRPLLLRFADTSERCRDLAVTLFTRWASGADASEVAGSLPFLMPVMVERLGSEAIVEPAEEVRALLAALMREVLAKCAALLRPYLPEFGAIALGCCRDTHPEVLRSAAELARGVAVHVLQPMVRSDPEGGKRVKPFSTRMLEALLPHVRHRHAAVRLEVLRALQEVLLCGAGQSVETIVGWRLSNNVPVAEFYGKGAPRINYMAELSRDRNPGVRRQLVLTVAQWMTRMAGEDLYEQEVRIIAYLLSGLFDDDDETAEVSRRELERLGAEHAAKNERDYKERIEYGAADEAAADAALTLPLPRPFKRRPSIGARGRVRDHFRSLIHPIVAELEQWTAPERLQSAQLLQVLLVYVEGHVTEFAHQLMPALAKAIDADGAELRAKVGECASLFAQHVAPSVYLPLLLGHVAQDALNTLGQRVQYACLLPPLLLGMRPHARAEALPHVLDSLAEEATLTSQHTPLRRAVRAAILALVAHADGDERAANSPRLLLALATWHASAPTLRPTTVKLADGVDDLVDAPAAAWAEAGSLLRADAAPLDPRWHDERSVAALLSQLRAAGAQCVREAERLVRSLCPPLAAGEGVAPLARAQRPAPRPSPAAAPAGGAARRAVPIEEVDDFDSSDDGTDGSVVVVSAATSCCGDDASDAEAPAAAPPAPKLRVVAIEEADDESDDCDGGELD